MATPLMTHPAKWTAQLQMQVSRLRASAPAWYPRPPPPPPPATALLNHQHHPGGGAYTVASVHRPWTAYMCRERGDWRRQVLAQFDRDLPPGFTMSYDP